MNCLVCNGHSEHAFQALVLKKYNVQYFRCVACGFIQTETPYWLDEAYTSAINATDLGLLGRNINLSKIVPGIIEEHFSPAGPFLDFAAGYGIFVRLMRDQGFDFRWSDAHCENLFAQLFELDQGSATRFELVTAFEVFEHMTEPVAGLKEMLAHTDSVLFTTHLQPRPDISAADEWGYFATETGQHISFHTHRSLEELAKAFDKSLYTNGSTLHLITSKQLDSAALDIQMPARHPDSLIAPDLERVLQSLDRT